MEQKQKVWITKYALTKGILAINARICDGYDDMIYYDGYGGPYMHGNDWHRIYTDAVSKAEKMRFAKIASLKKQIAKLEQMTFKTIE